MANRITPRIENTALRVAKILAAFILIVVAFVIISYEPVAAIPKGIPTDVEAFSHMDSKSASADAIKEAIGLFTTLALGLVAIAGYGIRDGLGNKKIVRAANMFLLSLFVMFLVMTLTQAYAGYGAIAIQLEAGFFFVTIIQKIIVVQIKALLGAAVTASLIFCFNLWSA